MGFITAAKREIDFVSGMMRMLRYVKAVDAESDRGIADDLEASCDSFADNLAFIEDDRRWTYSEFDAYANRVAHWALSAKLSPGDTVAIYARNRMEYVALWYGLSKVGVIAALLNFQLQAKALAHCVDISGARHLILDHELTGQWKTATPHLTTEIRALVAFGDSKGNKSFDTELAAQADTRPDRSHRAGILAGQEALKMFTSGTTGLPKAAKVTHVRAQNYMRGFAAAAKCNETDRMMMVLPLYHATGGLCGVGCALMKGGAVIVRPKFSASKFWDEAVEYKATLFMYVGELCRFMLSAPPSENERKHNIRFIIGNGLREEVWRSFIARFDIPGVIEFYGATEGNVSLINTNGRVGAMGRIPDYLKFRFNAEVVAHDVESGTIVRSSAGFCNLANPNEVGELLGEIRENEARFRYDGYQDKEASEKKIVRNVLKKGDAYFRTGDLVRRDKQGYIYFIDRIGDTFRWKAENVATGEVASALSSFKGITQANVYGVKVPGTDGRAGMASLVAQNPLDLEALHAHMKLQLPAYARPVFLRIGQNTDTTGTFKFKKTNLVKDGYDPSNIIEKLYVANPISGQYEVIDADIFAKINSGDLRL